MEDRLGLAIKLARESGKIIRDNFGRVHQVKLKADRSPVTDVDRRINALVAGEIRKAFPADGFLGEEENYGSGEEEYQWICDPLDGTKPFILGIPVSVFMLALSKGGKILLSVVYNPYSDEMYHAVKDGGSFCNDKPIKVSQEKIGEGYALIGSNSFVFAEELKRLSVDVEPVPGTGYKFMMIARGRGIGMINDSADFHDVGPASLIVKEAGGGVTGLNGEELDYSKEISGVIVSNGVVHDDFIRIVQSSS